MSTFYLKPTISCFCMNGLLLINLLIQGEKQCVMNHHNFKCNLNHENGQLMDEELFSFSLKSCYCQFNGTMYK